MIKNMTTHPDGKNVVKGALSYTAGGNANWYNHLEGTLVTLAKHMHSSLDQVIPPPVI